METEFQKEKSELEEQLAQPEIIADKNRFSILKKKYAHISRVVEIMEKQAIVAKELDDAKQMILRHDDRELVSLAEAEIATLQKQNEIYTKELQKIVAPSDPDDERNVIMEFRPGTGGDESALFAGELLRMYTRFAERRGWTVHAITMNQTDLKGIKEATIKISGKHCFSELKNESGVHRVQRIPETEKEGRVHTSTATVAVLPEVTDIEIAIEPKDLRIDTYLASGKGGQNVQKNETAVRITHLPTGLAVASQSERSQLQNKNNAMTLLRAKLFQIELEKQHSSRTENRRLQIGSAERSEKIRTYNFPQDRVTDHRTTTSWHNIMRIMDGDLDAIITESKRV